ncbi:MAG: hypothetical protein J5490_00135 [Bacteroidales bacterium]|nr:hypothetical protein [Bacteroidales bacterium]
MKRILSLLAVCAICCTPVFAQEADPESNVPQVSVIARFDYPVIPYLYTLVEGDLGELFSYSISNHWVSDEPTTPELYQNTWRADVLNWCDWANVSLNLGNWSFTVGKDIIAIGSFEIDQYDWDSYWEINSSFWNNAQVYQWGGKLTYATPSESNAFTLQATSSPFNYKPFDQKLLSYAAMWTGDFDIYRSLWSVNLMEYGKGKGENIKLFGSGNQLDVTDWLTLGLDYILALYDGASSHTFAYTADFHISDHFDFLVKGGCEAGGLPDFDMPYERGYIGGALQYYPLADSQDLRLHALACYDTIEGPLFSGGITYNLNLTNLFTR